MTGNALSASTAARTRSGVTVSRTPLRSSKTCRFAARSCIVRCMSTSNTVVTCAEVRRDRIMCSAIRLRIVVIGTTDTRSPGA